jgi:hypothetical protein
VSGCPGGRYPIADQGESGAQLFRIELWPAGVPTFRAGGSDTVAGSLGDEAPFELRGVPPCFAGHPGYWVRARMNSLGERILSAE